MPRPRTNNPSNLPSRPNFTTDPCRQQEILSTLHWRVKLVGEHYRNVRRFYGPANALNHSLAKLRESRKRGRLNVDEQQLHPEIRLLISHFAKRLANERGNVGVPTPDDQAAAIDKVLRVISPRRGRPADAILLFHLTAVIAAFQEAGGTPVMATRYQRSVYDPQAANAVGRDVIDCFRKWDPDLRVTTLVNAIEKIRVDYAERDLRFDDVFPAASIRTITPH